MGKGGKAMGQDYLQEILWILATSLFNKEKLLEGREITQQIHGKQTVQPFKLSSQLMKYFPLGWSRSASASIQSDQGLHWSGSTPFAVQAITFCKTSLLTMSGLTRTDKSVTLIQQLKCWYSLGIETGQIIQGYPAAPTHCDRCIKINVFVSLSVYIYIHLYIVIYAKKKRELFIHFLKPFTRIINYIFIRPKKLNIY